MFDRLVSLFSDCFLEIKWGKKEPTGERVVLNNSIFPHGKPREYAFLFTLQDSLNQPLVGKDGSRLEGACCSEFLNVQLIRFAVTNRPGVRGDQTRKKMMSHNINCELKAIYQAWRRAQTSVLHTAVSKHIMAVFSSAHVELFVTGTASRSHMFSTK